MGAKGLLSAVSFMDTLVREYPYTFVSWLRWPPSRIPHTPHNVAPIPHDILSFHVTSSHITYFYPAQLAFICDLLSFTHLLLIPCNLLFFPREGHRHLRWGFSWKHVLSSPYCTYHVADYFQHRTTTAPVTTVLYHVTTARKTCQAETRYL